MPCGAPRSGDQRVLPVTFTSLLHGQRWCSSTLCQLLDFDSVDVSKSHQLPWRLLLRSECVGL